MEYYNFKPMQAKIRNVFISISRDDNVSKNRKDFTSQEEFRKFLKDHPEITGLLI